MAAPPQLVGHTLGHYRVIEQIGAGGMGVIYRAHDEQLERDVAIKVLPVGTLADEAARKRFRKEALALAKLNHPNIATVHDFGTQDGTDFLVTEYIPGVTLDDKLAKGALPSKEAVGLGIQLAQGLSAAHEQGIVHRDLKPSNLRITPDGRLKILDFGLAQLMPRASDLGLTATMTKSQEITGTLPYMAPEQLRGEPADARTDTWAFGAVLYEMAAGKRPFPETNGPLLINAILIREPEPPSKLSRQVSAGLESVILKALDKDSARRYQTVRELGVDLERLTAGVSPLAKPRQKLKWPGITVGCAVVLLAIAIGGYFFHRVKSTISGSAASGVSTSIGPRRSVAVLGFKNLSGRSDRAWLSTALSEMLATELAAGEQLRTVPGEDVAQMKINLSLPDADSYGQATLAKIRTNLNADEVVVGSYIPIGEGQIRLDLRLQDAVRGETVAAISEKGSERQIDDLVSRAGAALREKLGLGAISGSVAAAVQASLPTNPESTRLYSEGLAKLRVFDALTARDLLEKAIVAEPNFVLAHSALAEAWSNLGYDDKAKAEARRAFELSANLSREQRLSVEGQYRQTTNESDKAIDDYRTLFSLAPDNLDYGLRLASAQVSASKGKDALVTIDAMRKLPLPSRDDPRIDLAEAKAHGSLSDFKNQQALAAQAVDKGISSGARLLVALAREVEGSALLDLGEKKKAMDAFEDAKRVYSETGNRAGVSRVLTDVAGVWYERGDLPRALGIYYQALAVARDLGDERSTARALHGAANALGYLNELSKAKEDYEAALKIEKETGDRRRMAATLTALAGLLNQQGAFYEAQTNFQSALAVLRELRDQVGIAYVLKGLSEVAFNQGDLVRAQAASEESLGIAREIGHKRMVAFDLSDIGDVLWTKGDAPAAHKKKEEALGIAQQIDEKWFVASVKLDMANMSIEEGHPKEAHAAAKQAAEEYHKIRVAGAEAASYDTLAKALLAEGNITGAQYAIRRAGRLVLRSSYSFQRLFTEITEARVLAAAGKPSEATKRLEATIAETQKTALAPAYFEARLALGQIEMKSGQTATGRAHLAVLEKDATAKGFLLIAHKAAAAAKG